METVKAYATIKSSVSPARPSPPPPLHSRGLLQPRDSSVASIAVALCMAAWVALIGRSEPAQRRWEGKDLLTCPLSYVHYKLRAHASRPPSQSLLGWPRCMGTKTRPRNPPRNLISCRDIHSLPTWLGHAPLGQKAVHKWPAGTEISIQTAVYCMYWIGLKLWN